MAIVNSVIQVAKLVATEIQELLAGYKFTSFSLTPSYSISINRSSFEGEGIGWLPFQDDAQ